LGKISGLPDTINNALTGTYRNLPDVLDSCESAKIWVKSAVCRTQWIMRFIGNVRHENTSCFFILRIGVRGGSRVEGRGLGAGGKVVMLESFLEKV
jgi:hypothetical protein